MDFPQREKVVRETAKNATRIRKAFDEAFNAAAIARAWSETHPAGEPVSPQMARDWALAHAVVKKKPLEVALSRLYADGYTLGDRIAKGRVLRMVTKSVGVGVVDWTTWVPGMPSASALVKPTGGLEELLRRRKITITDDIVRTKLDRIGSSLSRSLERGEDAFSTARGIREIINDPQHALMIARTEMARSMSVASRDVYKENSVQQVEWLVAEGCEDCQENADASPLPIDEAFPTGDFEPPAHPNCECAIAPVFDDTDLPAVEDVPAEGDESGSLESGDLETEIQPDEPFVEVAREAPAVGNFSQGLIDAYAMERNAVIKGDIESFTGELRAEVVRNDRAFTPTVREILAETSKPVDTLSKKELIRLSELLGTEFVQNKFIQGVTKKYIAEGWATRTASTQAEIEFGRMGRYIVNRTKSEYYKEKLAESAASTEKDAIDWYKGYLENRAIGEAKLADALANGNATIAVPRDIFSEILKSGRFKNQFETKTSGGTLGRNIRIEGEGFHLNINANVPGKQRPIYGFLSNGNLPQEFGRASKTAESEWNQLLNANGTHVSQYGDIRIILKPHMRDRSTVTLNDSLGRGAFADKLNAKKHDFIQLQAEENAFPLDNQAIPYTRYIELQYDKVELSDFEMVLVPKEDVELYRKLFKDKGLDIKVEARAEFKY